MLVAGLGKTKLGRLWTYVRDDRPAGDATAPAAWCAYTPDRKGERPKAHLSSFTGTLEADAYSGSRLLGARAAEVLRDRHVAHKSPVAQEPLRRIGELCAIEGDIHGRQPEERRRVSI